MQSFYTLRPIVQWPGELTKDRGSSPFWATWTQTTELLERELWHLNASQVVLQMAAAAGVRGA